jgi:hypothetical protein
MAKSHPDYTWVYELLSRIGEDRVSKGLDYTISRKVSLKPSRKKPFRKKPSRKTPSRKKPSRKKPSRAIKFKIVPVKRTIKGTGIPIKRLKDLYFSSRIHPSTLKKLYNFNRSYIYNFLRKAGANTEVAKQYSRTPLPHKQIEEKVAQYQSWIDQVAAAKGVKREYVEAGFRRSGRTDRTWERYVRALKTFTPKELKKNLHKKIIDHPDRLQKLFTLRGKEWSPFLRHYLPHQKRRAGRR